MFANSRKSRLGFLWSRLCDRRPPDGDVCPAQGPQIRPSRATMLLSCRCCGGHGQRRPQSRCKRVR